MKKSLIITCTIILSIGLVSSSCKKEKTGIAALHPETQEGKGTFGCLVNGEVFLPKGSALAGPVLQSWYQYTTSQGVLGYYFGLSCKTEKNDQKSIIYLKTNNMATILIQP